MAQLACGGGKTVCFAQISHRFFKRSQNVLVIAHRIELINQAAVKLKDVVDVPIGIIKAGIPANPACQIQVASIQTLARRKELPDRIGLVIFDEAHHVTASSYRRIAEYYKDSFILGVTATPLRIDGQGFEDLFDELVIGIDTETLIHHAYLSKFRLFATPKTISTYGVEKSKGDFRARDLALAVTNQLRAREILQNYRAYANNQQTIIYASSIAHSKEIASEFCSNSIKAEHLDGDTNPKLREEILARFQAGITQVITNYEILTEGYDYQNVSCVYCVRPTESPTLWLQMVGRALRVSSSSSVATIIDVTDNWKKHGLPDDPRQWSLSATSVPYPNRGLIQCEKCTHIFRPLSHEWQTTSAEIDLNGFVIRYHQASCPECAAMVVFTTKDLSGKTHQRVLVRLQPGMDSELAEINLEVSPLRIKQVSNFLRNEGLTSGQPDQIYKAIFMRFIKEIKEITLGDWRKIVNLVEPDNPVHTKKAWSLYQEATLRHNNRMAAIRAIEKRDEAEPFLHEQNSPSLHQGFLKTHDLSRTQKFTPSKQLLGNPYFKQKYAKEWLNSLAKCSESTAEFLNQNAGLFHVQPSASSVNISIEVSNIPDLKLKLKQIKQTELHSAFSNGFGLKAAVMFRLEPIRKISHS